MGDHPTITYALSLMVWFSLPVQSSEIPQQDSLLQNFINPPDSAKPWVYWWWLNSFVTKEGIIKDLEEMKWQGINGVLIFPAGGGATPPGPAFLSPAWMELFRFAIQEAARLKMEISMNLCDGWDAGGPWITPDQANKKLVYSEIQITGPGTIAKTLPLPPILDGYFHDIAVLAMREKPDQPVQPQAITASSSLSGYCDELNYPPADLADGDPNTIWRAQTGFVPSSEKPQWLLFQYHEPLPASAIFLVSESQGGPKECLLQASDDGKQFQPVVNFTLEPGQSKRIEFPEITAKFFHLEIRSAYQSDVRLAEVWLLRKGDAPLKHPGVKWWWFKSGNRSFWDWPKSGPAVLDEEYAEDGAIDCRSNEVVNLSNLMDANGKLQWEAPEGRWSILRFGYTLQGQRSRCASTSDTGYEADMLSAAGIESQFQHVAEPLLAAASTEVGKTLKYLHIDSYELGADIRGQQPTWSDIFREEFQKRRGYDLIPYLPALARRIVDSREKTNRFLWDYRRTIGDLMAEKFFQRFAELAHNRGVSVHSETGYGTYPHPHIDGLQCAGMNDVTMGEFWYGTDIMSQFNPFCNVIRSVASAAHIYGKRIIQAESFTAWSHFIEYPYALKGVGDLAFCDGLNRLVIHQYTHQPRLDAIPGDQYSAGTHVDRNLTWWEQSRAWFQYLSRCQSLLQSGRFHADVCYFYGEGATHFVPGREFLKPKLPKGYNFDAINADGLLHRVSVKAGRLALADGLSYRVLVLPEDRLISPPILQKIKELLIAGATVLGNRPLRTPGLMDFPQCDVVLKQMADELWGTNVMESGERRLGSGRLVWGKDLESLLKELNVSPDFETKTGSSISLEFTHRVIDEADIYFLSNQTETAETLPAAFRVTGKIPELWNLVTGACREATDFHLEGDQTVVPLEFAPRQSWFVVFRKPGFTPPVKSANFPSMSVAGELTGSWTVAFDPKWGGPESVVFENLIDWTKHTETGIRYYSGKATYQKVFDIPNSLKLDERKIFLDLGKVMNIAEVRLNGKNLGVVWCAPWQVEITDSVKATENALEIDVVNLWANRLIGDASLPENERFTRTNVKLDKNTPLLESGLLGPVKIISQ